MKKMSATRLREFLRRKFMFRLELHASDSDPCGCRERLA
jgi:hypothetical protein